MTNLIVLGETGNMLIFFGFEWNQGYVTSHLKWGYYPRNQVVSQEEVAELRGEVGELQTQLLRHQVAHQHIVRRGRA